MKVIHAGGEMEFGRAEATATIGLTDFSKRVTDDFGVTRLVPRGFARRMTVRLALQSSEVDVVQRQMAALRAVPVQWIVDEQTAWLNFEGFYKDFDLDLALPPLSYCSLTVEGLAETEDAANPIGDPAPNGLSSLRLVRPIDITEGMLASNIPENDHPEWAAGTTYALGARVIKAATHRIYESAAAGNAGNDPEAATGHWIDVGPTNRWAMLDESLGSISAREGSITVTIDADGVNAVALLDVTGASVRVQTTGYDIQLPVGDGAVTFLNMPLANAPITVTIAGSGTVSVGTLLLGRSMTLGTTEAAPKAALNDFSKKETDEFGEVTIVERAWAKRMEARALIRTDAIDLVANRLAAVRARPSLWIGDAEFDSLTVYGFAKDWSIERGETVSTLSLNVEGLSKAQPLRPVASAGFNPRGEYEAGASYAVGDVVSWPTSAGGTGDSFVRIGSGSTTGTPPSDGGKWAIFVEGGTPGADAQVIRLSSTQQAARFDASGIYVGGAITFRVERQGIPGGAVWGFRLYRSDTGVAFNAATAAYFATNFPHHFSTTGPDNLTFSAAAVQDHINAYGGFRVEAYSDGYAAKDTVSIGFFQDGQPGTSPYVMVIENDNHTVPADKDGNVTSYAGASFSVKVWHGDDDVTSSFTLATPWSSAGANNLNNLTVTGSWPSYTVTGGLDAGEDVATLRAVLTGSGAHAGAVVAPKVFSLSKSKAGQDGSSPPLITLDANSTIARYGSNNTYAGGPITFTARRENIPGGAVWGFRLYRSDTGAAFNAATAAYFATNFPNHFSTTGPDNLTFSAAAVQDHINAYGGFRVEAYSDGYAATDSVAVTKVKDGDNGAPGLNSTQVEIFRRSASLPALPAQPVTFDFASRAIAGLTNGWTASVPATDGNPLYVAVATAATAAMTDTIAANEWSQPVIIVQDGEGLDGLNSASVFLFRRAASAPPLPSTESTYTFASGQLTGQNNGWTRTIPENDGNPLWITTATASATTATDTIPASEWAAAEVLAENGSDGEPGYTISPPSVAWNIAASQNGVPDAQQLPRSVTMKVMQGAVDVTADPATTFALGPQSGFTASLGGSNGQTFTLTAMSADTAKAAITVSRDGTTIAIVEVGMTKQRRGAAAVQFEAALTALGAASTFALTGSIDLNLPAGAGINADASAVYSVNSGNYTPELKLTYQNITDGGAEIDFPGSNPTQGTNAATGEPGSVDCPAVSLSPGHAAARTYRVRLYSRRVSGAANPVSVSGKLYARTG